MSKRKGAEEMIVFLIDFGPDEIIRPETLREWKRFERAARKAFSLGLMDSKPNTMEPQKMLIHDKKHMRKLLKKGIIDKKLIRDLNIEMKK